MRESMPGRPSTYNADEQRPPSELDQLYETAAQLRQQLIDTPPPAPDEFAVAAAKVADKAERRRGPEWHRARVALGG